MLFMDQLHVTCLLMIIFILLKLDLMSIDGGLIIAAFNLTVINQRINIVVYIKGTYFGENLIWRMATSLT